MRLNNEEYKKAVGCLKRYNYNCLKIHNIQADIMSIGSPSLDGMPKAPYRVSDSVLNSVIKLQEDKELQRAIREYNIVLRALALTDKITNEIFEEQYQKGEENKWDIIDKLNISEDVYKRRRRKLIYLVHNELLKTSLQP